MKPIELRVCIDVEDMDQALSFYTGTLPLRVGRRHASVWVELLGAACPLDLLAKKAGTKPAPLAARPRSYDRHWTPVHLDFVVDDLDAAVQRAVAAGAVLERGISEEPYGRIATLADPFGHGLCLLQLSASGYDAIADP